MASIQGSRSGGWTEQEKYSFLLQVLKQHGIDNIKVKFADLNLPGRTPKALTHVWTKIRTEVAEAGGAEVVSPAVPRKRGKAKGVSDAAEGTPTKKRKASPKKKAAKKEENGEADEMDAMPELPDYSGDEGFHKDEEDVDDDEMFHEADEEA